MQSLIQFFGFMHGVNFPYVVLRNFDNLPHSIQSGEHGDLDLLVYDRKHFEELFPDIKLVHKSPRVMYKANMNGLNIYMDIRYVGDGYYPTAFELNILETRELNPNGFFTPNPNHFRLALAYHAVHHKNNNSYKKYLGEVEVKDLLESLKKSRIGYSKPEDDSVGTHNQYWKGATSIVSKDGDKVFKKQTGYNEYNLIDNEYRILKDIDIPYFPKVYKEKDGISIEDCGERLCIDNLPEHWKKQLVDILKCLKNNKIIHRDIKPDNLMVKDGIIKLIDFGWAILKGEKDNPPTCLGYPYKPSWGHDDNFSMMKTIKELEYKREELLCVS